MYLSKVYKTDPNLVILLDWLQNGVRIEWWETVMLVMLVKGYYLH